VSEMPGPLPIVRCSCHPPTPRPGAALPEDCVCSDQERVLRAYVGEFPDLPPMSPEQRAWCLEEIASMGDSTQQGDFAGLSDGYLARQVLQAWLDYARDKGVI